MSDVAVTRWLRGYHRDHDKMVVEYQLPSSWTLERLQKLFAIPAENPLYDCYPVDNAQAESLGASLGIILDTDAYEFFLEADAGEE